MAGIDLGTSNSAIAHVEGGKANVIRPKPTDQLLPSAVFIERSGKTWVGDDAIRAILVGNEEQGSGYSGWKPRMGQDDRYHFSAARKTKSGPELSAIIIGELLGAYQRHTGEQLVSCVITVPAKFDQSAYNATGDAAKLAGLEHFPLLQEPIAAALAYGFSGGDQRANWMIFDLGAGTLDVSLMAVREGNLLVLPEGQAGDPNLGGKNFDRELMDFVLGAASHDRLKRDRYNKLQPNYEPLRSKYQLDSFSEKNNRTAWNRLRHAVERAKIELSKRDEAVVELDSALCKDERGKPVDVEVTVTREAYEKLIAADVEKAAHICQTLLKRNRLRGGDIDEFILVGGPTSTPYVRKVLSERLEIELHVKVDPMVAVAQGAALHSELVEPPAGFRSRKPVVSLQSVSLDLQYERASKQPSCTVAGTVGVPGADLDQLTVEVRRADDLWTSGRLPLDETGFFCTDVMLVSEQRPVQSNFVTEVFSAEGTSIAKVDEPNIWHPWAGVDTTLANSMGIAAVGNEVIVLVSEGDRLPARKSKVVQTAAAIRRGSSDDVLRIPVIEAVHTLSGREDTRHADCSVHVGSLVVNGDDEQMTGNLPQGSEVDVSFEIDDSRRIKITAYVPLLDAEFEATFSDEPYGVELNDIKQRFENEQKRLEKIHNVQRESPKPLVAEILATIDELNIIAGIEAEIARIEDGESSSLSRVWRRTLELAGTLNEAWAQQVYGRINRLLATIRADDTGENSHRIKELEEVGNELGPNAEPLELEKLEEDVNNLHRKVRLQPYYRLHLRAAALSGKRARVDQVAVANEVIAMSDRLSDKGEDGLTAADMREIERMNRRVEEKFPDIDIRVQELLDGLPAGTSPQEAFGSTVRNR